MMEAIQAEETVSSNVIKMVILDEFRKELAKKKKIEKKKSSSASETANGSNNNKSWIIANTDNNLERHVVELNQYIYQMQWCI